MYALLVRVEELSTPPGAASERTNAFEGPVWKTEPSTMIET